MNPKHVTSPELSKQLKEAGIPQESEWYWVPYMNGEVVRYKLSQDKVAYARWGATDEPIYSAFHVGELGEMLKNTKIKSSLLEIQIGIYKTGTFTNFYSYTKYDSHDDEDFSSNTEAEARGKMLLYLKKEGLV